MEAPVEAPVAVGAAVGVRSTRGVKAAARGARRSAPSAWRACAAMRAASRRRAAARPHARQQYLDGASRRSGRAHAAFWQRAGVPPTVPAVAYSSTRRCGSASADTHARALPCVARYMRRPKRSVTSCDTMLNAPPTPMLDAAQGPVLLAPGGASLRRRFFGTVSAAWVLLSGVLIVTAADSLLHSFCEKRGRSVEERWMAHAIG